MKGKREDAGGSGNGRHRNSARDVTGGAPAVTPACVGQLCSVCLERHCELSAGRARNRVLHGPAGAAQLALRFAQLAAGHHNAPLQPRQRSAQRKVQPRDQPEGLPQLAHGLANACTAGRWRGAAAWRGVRGTVGREALPCQAARQPSAASHGQRTLQTRPPADAGVALRRRAVHRPAPHLWP
jgi:hypothetical protein